MKNISLETLIVKNNIRKRRGIASGDLGTSCVQITYYWLKCRHGTARAILNGFRSS